MGRHPCRSSTAGRSRTSSSPASPWSPRAAWARTASFTRRRCWPSARRASPRPRIPSDASTPAPQVLASSRPRRAGARPPRQIFDLVGTRAGAEACVGSCARSVTHLRDALPRVLAASLAPPVDAAKYAADLGAVILGYLGAGALLAGLVMAGFSAVLSFWAGLQENAVMVQVGRRAFFAAATMAAAAKNARLPTCTITAFSWRPAQKDSTAEKPAMTRPASRAPAPRYPSITAPRSAAYFAASTGGAKEATSTRGSASCRCVTERAQEPTQASAPARVPTKSKIWRGGRAPARLGREDARTCGAGILASLGIRGRGEARRALGQQRRRVKDAVRAQAALGDHGDAGLEDVRERPAVLDRHGCRPILLSERHVQPAVALLNVGLDHPRDADVTVDRVRTQLADREVVLGGAPGGRVDQVADARRDDKGGDGPPDHVVVISVR